MKNIETESGSEKKTQVMAAFRLKGWAFAEPFLQAVDKYELKQSDLLRMCVEESLPVVVDRLENKKKETRSILERVKVNISSRLRLRNQGITC
jgi:hypothetical protein